MDYIPSAPVYEVDKPTKFDCNIVLKNEDFTYLRVIVYYRASFGNDGTEAKLFIFKKGQYKYEKVDVDK